MRKLLQRIRASPRDRLFRRETVHWEKYPDGEKEGKGEDLKVTFFQVAPVS